MADVDRLKELSKLVRYYILEMTTKAGSGHPTSSLSATDLMVCLFFNKLRFDLKNPQNPENDRVVFSKGHASPLMYALYAAAGVFSEEELLAYRQFKSPLEGHPTPRFKFAEAATGSLGQGLSIGLGMAIALRAQNQSSKVKNQNLPNVYVLMGDGEVAEGSVWEALEVASYYKVGNLVGVIDVNRLGQSGETLLGWDVERYKKRIEAFGWQAYVVDGHDLGVVCDVFEQLDQGNDKPKMIIAKTVKGKGVSFLEDREGWHGKALKEDEFKKAVKELGKVDLKIRGKVRLPDAIGHWPLAIRKPKSGKLKANYKLGEEIATRKAYGEALTVLAEVDPLVVSLDADVKNSTYTESFNDKYPERFFEMFIAEQNMVGVAVGMATRGYIPFVSTFGVFLTRAFDQIRMAGYSRANVKFLGSHAGVSIGEDGPSQMGLEDLAMFRTVPKSTILYPADGVAAWRMVELAAQNEGIFYSRTNRPATPVIYTYKEASEFKIGGSKVVRSSDKDRLTIVACGVTLIEAIKAADELAKKNIKVRVIDAYSVKPIDQEGLRKAASETNNLVITVEDHYPEGGLGDAVLNVFATQQHSRSAPGSSEAHSGSEQKHPGGVQVYKLAVSKMPRSGKPQELLDFEGISARAITDKVKEIL